MNTVLYRLGQYILFRVLIAVTLSATVTFFLLRQNWLWAGISILLLAWGIWWSWSLYSHQQRKVHLLLDALENNDNSLRFPESEGPHHDLEINRLLNRIATILYDTKANAQQQEKYYELILSCVNTGIVVLNKNGSVYQKNNELLRLLGLEVFTHISQLSKVDSTLMQKLSEANPGDRLHVSFSNERGTLQLSVRVSGITIGTEYLRILALNDINNELDEKELDSWIRLIRVLTHEIMNAITPITSLSDTLLSIPRMKDEEMLRGLQTISTTSKGLLSFVESYRKFARIPTPEPSLFCVKPFIERMVQLAKHQYSCGNITVEVTITPPDLIVHADENLIGQVIINLLKNAIEAIAQHPDGRIEIHAHCNKNEEILIELSNNGPCISPEVAEQIFVPFFTTKQEGSGIGLSLARQIMRLSGGSLSLLPTSQTSKTTFVLSFK